MSSDDPDTKGRFDLAATFYAIGKLDTAVKQGNLDRKLLVEPLLQLVAGFLFVGIFVWLGVVHHPANLEGLWWWLLAVAGFFVYAWRGLIPMWKDARLKLIGAALYFMCFFFLLLYKVDDDQASLRMTLMEIGGFGVLLYGIGKWRNREFSWQSKKSS